MIELIQAIPEDIAALTETQRRTFLDDNKNKPPGCDLGGPPGFDSPAWNLSWLGKTPYYKIVYQGEIAGGLILFPMGDPSEAQGEAHIEVGRIWVDPLLQNRGIGQAAMRAMFELHPQTVKWTLGTPEWAQRNHHFYEKLGFVKVRETPVEPELGWAGYEYERICG